MLVFRRDACQSPRICPVGLILEEAVVRITGSNLVRG
jgi:hypothetical protein